MLKRRVDELSAEGIFLDLVLALVTYFSSGLRAWVVGHASTAFWFAGVLQCGAMFAIVYGGLWSKSERPLDQWVDEKLGVLKVLLLILAAGGFMWLFIPAATLGLWGAFTINFFVTIFGSVGVMAFYWDNQTSLQTPLFRILGIVAVLLYLVVSESLMIASALAGAQVGAIVMGLAFSYIPIRTLLLLRPPLNLLELVSAAASFAYFMVNLFVTIL